jgi:formylglycine-generating enzyme required for sulfatase activity
MRQKTIFLASSAELKHDREQFEIFINRKNNDWVERGVFLKLIVWEDFLDAVSETRLQDEYNKAIRECDIFVMLFFTKVGKYTEEEFETAFGQFRSTNKPFIFTYFKDSEIRTGSANKGDLMSLWNFQDKLKTLGHFCTVYENIDALQLGFSRQLDKLAASGFIEFKYGAGDAATPPATTNQATLIGPEFGQVVIQPTHPGDDPQKAKSIVALYLQALVNDLAGLKLGAIDASGEQTQHTPLKLADVYVPLDTILQIPMDASLGHWLSRERNHQRDEADTEGRVRPVSLLEALAEHRELTVLGKPGSGKSTFGASVLLTLAEAWLGHGNDVGKLGPTWTHGVLLPIRVVLRRFAEQLPPGNTPARAGDLWAFIARDLEASGYEISTNTIDDVRRIARLHGALIVFDGLDECGDSERRERVLKAVEEVKHSAGEACRFVLTARPYAWPKGPEPIHGVYALADLSDSQIEEFIRSWYAAAVKRNWLSPGEADHKMSDLLGAHRRADLVPLAKSPLLLTLMAQLNTARGRLPDDRVDLYNESVELLLLRWNRQIGADKALLDELALPSLRLSDLREALEELAFKIHQQNVGLEGTADIGADRLVRAFCPLLNHSRDKAEIVVDFIEKRAGLLVGQGEKDGERQFTFPHRTFQEYLAACHLAAQQDFPSECANLAREAPAHWQVVLPLAARIAKTERGVSAADELIGGISVIDLSTKRKPNRADWMHALLAGTQIQEIGVSAVNKSERTRSIAARVADWLVACLPVHPDEGGLPATQRAQAGDVLAALGDPRFDSDRFYLPATDMLGFVRIPADMTFSIGSRKDLSNSFQSNIGLDIPDDELNDAVTPTQEFFIGRYPVTVAQFQKFLDDTPMGRSRSFDLRDPGNRPVRKLSWSEASAYCKWLNEHLATSNIFKESDVASLVLTEGWSVDLPSELEWEKAARGGTNTIFPWGDTPDVNMANSWYTGIGETSAVGCFPANRFGLYDMVGNAWEWTRSRYTAYPYRAEDSGGVRQVVESDQMVVRGASFGRSHDLARCACRHHHLPENYDRNFGFRLVLRKTAPS